MKETIESSVEIEKFERPWYLPGDEVEVQNHKRTIVYEGVVSYVETIWRKDGSYWHAYNVKPHDLKTTIWTDGDLIVGRINK